MTREHQVPEGLSLCVGCGEYRGRCRSGDLSWDLSESDLDGLPEALTEVLVEARKELTPPPDEWIEVSCLCSGPLCRYCKKNRHHRPISNAYDPVENAITHFPSFWGLRGCDTCAGRRAAQSE